MRDEDWQWHYVKLNEACRYPRRIVCLDTESYRHLNGDGERHSFMLGVASFDRIDPRTREPRETEWIESPEPEPLWEWIAGHTKSRERTIVFAHNLGYDLRISQAFTLLPKLGFRLRFISLDSRRCYARFSRDGATLVLSDSTSYFPKSLEAIGAELGMAKLPLPGETDDPDKWFSRCRGDVEILRSTMLHLLDWLEGNDSGNFKPTGPAQAWATFRHKHLRPRSLLVHRDEDALDAERAAAWTGRTEAWRHGEYHTPLLEYDYRLAYATIAAMEDVPARFIGTQAFNRPLRGELAQPGVSRLFRCRVTTPNPSVPCSLESRIAWPIGSYETVLWDREAQLAIDNGAEIHAERAYLYRTAPILREWGKWIIAQLTDDSLGTSPLIRIMLKHWARCLIGRFGMRYPDWHVVGRSNESGLVHFDCFDMDSEERSEYLQIANDWYSCSARKNGHDTAPAVMSYIVSLQRIKLWQAIQAAGELETFYCDTDSLLVSPAGAQRLDELRLSYGHDNLIRKARFDHAEIFAPRCIILDGEARISGLPRRATATSNRTYKTEAWQTLSDSLKTDSPTSVRVFPRSFRIPTEDHRRRHLAHGHTAPYEVSLP